MSDFREDTIIFQTQLEWQKISLALPSTSASISRWESNKQSTLRDKDLWVVWKLFQPENILLQIAQAQSMNVGHPD